MAYSIRHIFSLLLLVLSLRVSSQNISKHYSSLRQEKGILFFVFPTSGFHDKDNDISLTYDLTYLTCDSNVTFNFSYYDKINNSIDSIVLMQGEFATVGHVKKLFVDLNKKKWHHRYTTTFPYIKLNVLYSKAEKPWLILFTKLGVIKLSLENDVWENDRKIKSKIFTLISENF